MGYLDVYRHFMEEGKAVAWRGSYVDGRPLQQMLGQVGVGELRRAARRSAAGDGRRAMTFCTKPELSGAIVVSTPQDVALMMRARRLMCQY